MKNTDDVSDKLFDTIYENYSRLVKEIIYSVLGNNEQAKDAFQMTFISVAQKMDKIIKLYPDVKNYIAKIAYNSAINEYRKAQRILKNEVPFPDEEDVDDEEERVRSSTLIDLSAESFEEALFRKHDRIRLLEVLGKLDDKYSVYIQEHFFESLTMRQIAERHGIREEAAKKRVQRSVEKLKDMFFKKGGCSE